MLPATTNRRELIAGFRKLGWGGPISGGKHSFMMMGSRKQTIPNTDVDRTKLKDLLKQAGISEDQWKEVL